MRELGLEPSAGPCPGKDLQQSVDEKARECADSEARSAVPAGPADPDLREVIGAWPDLPEAIKAGIVAMIGAAGKKGPK